MKTIILAAMVAASCPKTEVIFDKGIDPNFQVNYILEYAENSCKENGYECVSRLEIYNNGLAEATCGFKNSDEI